MFHRVFLLLSFSSLVLFLFPRAWATGEKLNTIGVRSGSNRNRSLVRDVFEPFAQELKLLRTYPNEPEVTVTIAKKDIPAVHAALKNELDFFQKPNNGFEKNSPTVWLALVYAGNLKESKAMYRQGVLNGNEKHIYVKYGRDIAKKRQHTQLLEWLMPLATLYELAIKSFSDNNLKVLLENTGKMDNWTLHNFVWQVSTNLGTYQVDAVMLSEVIRKHIKKDMFSQAFMADIMWNCLSPRWFQGGINYGEDVAKVIIKEGYVDEDSHLITQIVNLEYVMQRDRMQPLRRWVNDANLLHRLKINFSKDCFQSLVFSLRKPELVEEKFYKYILKFKPPTSDNAPLKIAMEELANEEVVQDLRKYGFRRDGEQRNVSLKKKIQSMLSSKSESKSKNKEKMDSDESDDELDVKYVD